jgi:hypothetical protein
MGRLTGKGKATSVPAQTVRAGGEANAGDMCNPQILFENHSFNRI